VNFWPASNGSVKSARLKRRQQPTEGVNTGIEGVSRGNRTPCSMDGSSFLQ
jgi:hypothetical protein